MRRQLGFLLKDSVLYGAAGAANRFVKVLLVPVVARTFPTEAFGVFDTLNIYIYVLAVLGILGLNSAVVIFASPGSSRRTGEGWSGPASTGLRMVLTVSLGVTALVLIAPGFWSRLFLDTDRYGTVIAWAAASIPCSAVLIYGLGLLQWTFRRTWYISVALGSAILTIALSAFVAFATSTGLVGLFAANLAGQAVGAILALIGCRDMLRGAWDSALARRMLAIGLPFAVIGIAGNLLPSIDRMFLVRAHSLTATGLYGMGQKIAALAAITLMGFQGAWGPFAFRMRDDAAKPRLFGRVFLLICTATGYLALLLTFAAPWIATLAGGSTYIASTIFVGPLALSSGLSSVFFVVAIGSVLEGRSLHNLAAYVVGIAVSTGLNLGMAALGTPAVGIAWANFLGQAVAVAGMAWLSHRVHPIAYPFWRGGLVLGVAAGSAFLLGRMAAAFSLTEAVAAILGLTAIVGVWCWLGVLDPGERRRIRTFLVAR